MPRLMSSGPRLHVALVTSGGGTRLGGIGVVAQLVARALEGEVRLSLWRHHPNWPRAIRVPAAIAEVAWGARNRPDLILYSHLDLSRLSVVLPQLRGIPYGILLHGVEIWSHVTGLRQRALMNASFLISVSSFTICSALAVNHWLPRAHVVWPGVTAPRPSHQRSRRNPVALIVGRMEASERRKGHDWILDAWPEIIFNVPEAKLKIIGDGNDAPRLRNRVRVEGITGVEFLGRVSDSDRDAYYDSSRLLLLPSLQEGFGLAAIEAAATGMPVLGLKQTVMEELFPHGGAVLADHPTGSAIAAAAIPVLSDIELADRLGTTAQARVHAEFLEKHFRARFQAVLRPFLNGH